MARTKMRRDSKGRFIGKARSSRKRRRSKSRSRSRSRSRSSRRRNPDLFGQVAQATTTAGMLLAGEAVTRSVPRMAGLPSTGPMGLAVQAGVAVAAGMAAERLLDSDAGAIVMAAGLAVPLRQLIAGANIPYLSDSMRAGGVGAYVQPRRSHRLAAYVQPGHSMNGYSAPCGNQELQRSTAAGVY